MPALGIEEQRVHATIDFLDPPDAWSRPGYDYRVVVRDTIWGADNVLTLPMGALLRIGDERPIFAARNGRARTSIVRKVTGAIGQRFRPISCEASGTSLKRLSE